MKHIQKVLVSISTVALLIGLVGCSKSAASLHPNIAMPGEGIDVELALPATLSETTWSEDVYLYELSWDEEEIQAEIEKTFSIDLALAEKRDNLDRLTYQTEEYIVTIDKNNGYWSYGNWGNINIQNEKACAMDEAISDSEAINIATTLVEEAGLWQGDFSDIGVGNETTGGWNEPELLVNKCVYFYPTVEGKPVYGIYRIMVTLDPDGELISLDKRATEVSRKVTTSLKSKLAVQEALEAKEYSAGFESALEDAKITDCEVAYYADAEPKSGKTYLYPVYVMTGEGRNPDGKIETFDLIMDGVE